MKFKEFKVGIWVIFRLKDVLCIGITGLTPDGQQAITAVSELHGSGAILFNAVDDVDAVEYLFRHQMETDNQNNPLRQYEKNPELYTLTNHISKTLNYQS